MRLTFALSHAITEQRRKEITMHDHVACTVKIDALWAELLKVAPERLASEMSAVFRTSKEVVKSGGPCPYHTETTED